MDWSDARIETLKERWAAGHSASHIAAELGGVTRNAIIGKVHRLGLPSRIRTVSPRAPRERAGRRVRAVKFVRDVLHGAELPRIPALNCPAPFNLTLLELVGNTCRFICDGSGLDAWYCGNRIEGSASYCAYHTSICYAVHPR
jgi:GcrA cell cycle regulator